MPSPVIVYLHGFNSAAGSAKGRLIARRAAASAQRPLFHLPTLPHLPAQAIAAVSAWIDAHAPGGRALTLVGSSLGGYYATWLAEKYGARAVLINPAVRPFEDLRPCLGRQRNPHTGEDYDVTPGHLDQLIALQVPRITRPERYLLLVRSGDEVLDWRIAVAFYAGAFQHVAGGGDHGWADFAAPATSVLHFAGCGE